MTAREQQELLAAILRIDFPTFLQKVFTTLSPGQTYVPGWHIDAIACRLERVRLGEIRRLIINMPPRSLKSIAGSVAFPAFALSHNPSRRIICVSYSGDLAKKHSNDFRAVIDSPWYRAAFPATRIGPFKDSETEIEFTARGFRLATSVGGTLTGRGGDIIVIDDPLKPDDALSETKRSAANHWFTNTLLSRLDDKRTGAIVVVMQRVHIDDLTGFLLGQSKEWDVLSLPAIADVDEVIPVWGGRTYHRKSGEALSPEREPIDVLDALKLQIGSDAFYAQYQQMPVPAGGAMIKRHWVRRYSAPPHREIVLQIIQSWDTAMKGGPANDYSVCTTWAQTCDCKMYLLDVWRGRVDYPTLKDMVLALQGEWRPSTILIEETGTAIGLIDELEYQCYGVVGIKPDRDKIARMAIASAKFEAGNVYLPESAPWLADLEAELFAFPGSHHDDQCDSISQALNDERAESLATYLKAYGR
jgi:predicted phage terminase large subunit-like protein